MIPESLILEFHEKLVSREEDESLEITLTALDELWLTMGEEEKRLYSGVLEDLKSLRDSEDTYLAASQKLAESGDWDGVLKSLRVFTPCHRKSEVASLRARAWKELGFSSIAEKFEKFSEQTTIPKIPELPPGYEVFRDDDGWVYRTPSECVCDSKGYRSPDSRRGNPFESREKAVEETWEDFSHREPDWHTWILAMKEKTL